MNFGLSLSINVNLSRSLSLDPNLDLSLNLDVDHTMIIYYSAPCALGLAAPVLQLFIAEFLSMFGQHIHIFMFRAKRRRPGGMGLGSEHSLSRNAACAPPTSWRMQPERLKDALNPKP